MFLHINPYRSCNLFISCLPIYVKFLNSVQFEIYIIIGSFMKQMISHPPAWNQLKKKLSTYLFILELARPSLPWAGFLWLQCVGFSLQWLLWLWSTGCRVHRLQWWLPMGLVAPWHVASSQTRGQTCVPRIGRQILNHWTTREVLRPTSWKLHLIQQKRVKIPGNSLWWSWNITQAWCLLVWRYSTTPFVFHWNRWDFPPCPAYAVSSSIV